MAVVRVQVNMDRDSLLPADTVINTIYYKGPGDFVLAADAEDICEAVAAAYVGLDGYWASTLAGTGTVEAYDMGEPEPRVPIASAPLAITPSASAMPAEVALCLSFQATPVSGGIQSRRRGRIYIGPLTTTISAVASGASDARPNSATMTDWLDFGLALSFVEIGGVSLWRHSVFSARSMTGPVTLDGATVPIDEYWVDNAFDTQRRRGARSTTRQTAPVVLP